jgi:REP element-mobilizing transposase RayT
MIGRSNDPPARHRRRARQLELRERRWGGRRPGAGRKRRPGRRRVPHRRRPHLDREHPVHVTLRMRASVPNLRRSAIFRAILRVLRRARGRFGLRVVEFAVLGNHVHLVVEAEGAAGLTRGMRGLCTRIAIHLNRALARGGRVLDDRYHARQLRTPLEVRRGLLYVLNNARRHAAQRGLVLRHAWIDPFSSGPIFEGWLDGRPRRALDCGTLPARTWLLREGWRRHGLLGVDEIPGGAPRSSRAPPGILSRL